MHCRAKRLQPKLRVGRNDDPFERDADNVADHVMASSDLAASRWNAPLAHGMGSRDTTDSSTMDSLQGFSGEPLGASTRGFMESRFGCDFSRVRVHTHPAANESAHELGALAYTAGNHVVFARGTYQPHSTKGRHLLAHELAHVIQQRSGADSALLARRKGVTLGGFFGNLFHFWDYSPETLQKYLKVLDQTGDIEDDDDSDDKARQIVKEWKVGGSPYVLTEQRKALMIREMQSGFTGDDDELAILELLEHSYNGELSYIYGAGGVTVAGLDSDFHGEEWDRLKDFYRRRFDKGYEGALKGDLTPVGDATPLGSEMLVPGASVPMDIDAGVTTWNVPCVLGILCSQDRNVVAQLPKTTVQKADTITEFYWEFDGTSWNMLTRQRGAAHDASQNEVTLKATSTCAATASSIMHEMRHHAQPANLTPTEVEVDAYTFEEQWTIDRGLPARPLFRSGEPGSGKEKVATDKVEAYVKKRYSGSAAGAPTEHVIGHLPDGKAKVRRPDGSTYTRPAQKGESHQDYERTKTGLSNLPKVDPKEWQCPGKP
jgi:hypothetical protein